MNQLALLHWRQGRLDEAEPLYREALEVSRRVLGADHADDDGVRDEPGQPAIGRRGATQEAEPLYEHNLETQLRVLGAEHPSTLDTMGNLANLLPGDRPLRAGGSPPSPGARDRGGACRARRRPATVSEMNNLANDLALLGRFEEAAPLMQRTLELKMELYGAAHPTTLNSVSNLGDLDDQLGRDAEAEALHRQALDGRTRALGPTP